MVKFNNVNQNNQKAESEPSPYSSIHCRVWQIPNSETDDLPSELPQSEIKKHIDWDSTKPENYIEFEYGGQKYYLVHSRPAWYTYWKDNFKLVDLLVVGTSAERAQKQFTELKELALIKRAQMLEKVKQIIPELEKIPEVSVIMGRGTMFNQYRLPATGSDDADIMIFLNLNFRVANDIQEILIKLRDIIEKHSELNGYYGIYSFQGSSQDTPLLEGRNDTEFNISFDLFPLPFLQANIDSLLPHLKPYYIEALKEGAMLLDRSNGDFKDLTRKVVINS